MTKICSKCGEEKDISEFNKNKSRKDGLCCYCKLCDREYRKQYRLNNLEKIRQYERNQKQKHPDGASKRFKKWYLGHQEQEKQKRKKSYQTNPEKRKEYHKQLRINYPLKYLLRGCISRAKKRNIPYDPLETLETYLQPIFDKQQCQKCGIILQSNVGHGKKHDSSPSIDQIIPDRGYVVENVTILCSKCNMQKNNHTIETLTSWINWFNEQKTGSD